MSRTLTALGRSLGGLMLRSSAQRSMATVSSAALDEAFRSHALVPDVITRAPKQLLNVSFAGGHTLHLGNILTPTDVKERPPKVEWDADAAQLYTLLVTDPDAPSRAEPTYREWHHWLLVNIAGGDMTTGDVLADYIGSGPPEGTGLHRYVYLVYKQQGRLTDAEHGALTSTSADGRGAFSTAAFANKHALGDPVAGNFFQAEYDDYVPMLYKSLGA